MPGGRGHRYARALGAALTGTGFIFGLLLIEGMTWRTDAAVYWLADLDHLYSGVAGEPLAFLYSPAYAQVLEPLRLIPLETFVWLWRFAELAVLTYAARWLTLPILLVVWPVTGELVVGQVHLLMAAAILASRRWPGLWAAVILTKPTLGVGLAYYIGKRDGRALAIALGTLVVVAGISFALAPSLWFDWVQVLRLSQPGQPEAFDWPVWIRLPFAAGLAFVAGARDWRWLEPIAAVLALPVLWWVGLSMATASLVDLRPAALRLTSSSRGMASLWHAARP